MFEMAGNLATDVPDPERRPEDDSDEELGDEPAEHGIQPRGARRERINLGRERAHRREATAVAVREALQDVARVHAEWARVLDAAEDLEGGEEGGADHVRGEGAEREEAEARVEEDGEEVARERAREGEEERGGGLVPEARGEAEVHGVRGGIDEHRDSGDGVADRAGGWREGGDVREEELGQVCAESDRGERDGEGENGLP